MYRFMAQHVGHKIEILPDGVSTVLCIYHVNIFMINVTYIYMYTYIYVLNVIYIYIYMYIYYLCNICSIYMARLLLL